MWEIVWQTFVGLGGIGLVLAVVGWAVKTLVAHQLSMEVERHKNELKERADQELERMRTEEKMRALEHEVRFRKLHEGVVEAVTAVFLTMSELFDALKDFAFAAENDTSRRAVAGKRLSEAEDAFKGAYKANRLFLPVVLFRDVEAFDDLVFSTSMACVHAASRDQIWMKGVGARKEADEAWQKARHLTKTKVQPLLDRFHEDFQRLLGYAPVDRSERTAHQSDQDVTAP